MSAAHKLTIPTRLQYNAGFEIAQLSESVPEIGAAMHKQKRLCAHVSD
jgi:hypothetical protein